MGTDGGKRHILRPKPQEPKPIFIGYKTLKADGSNVTGAAHRKVFYPLPTGDHPGEWLDVPGAGASVALVPDGLLFAAYSDSRAVGGILVEMECEQPKAVPRVGAHFKTTWFGRVRILRIIAWSECPACWKEEAKKRRPELFEEPKPQFKVGEYVVSQFVPGPLRIATLGAHDGYDANLEYPNGSPCWLDQADFSPWQPKVGDRVVGKYTGDGYEVVTNDEYWSHVDFQHVVAVGHIYLKRFKDGAYKIAGLDSLKPASFAPKPTKDEPDPDEELMEEALFFAKGICVDEDAYQETAANLVAFHTLQLTKKKADATA